jgi:GDPmannose 4,6-dehydratase
MEIIWKGTGLYEKGVCKESGKIVIEIAKEYFRPSDVNVLLGNSSKAKEILGWNPKIQFRVMVKEMIENDLELVKRWVRARL